MMLQKKYWIAVVWFTILSFIIWLQFVKIHRNFKPLERTLNKFRQCMSDFQPLPRLFEIEELRRYEQKTLTPNHPMAYSFLVHKDLPIFEIFMSMHFRPEDFYCVHLDSKVRITQIFNVWLSI